MPSKKLRERVYESDPNIRVIYVSTYPPRECGIATFSRELIKGINTLNPHFPADVVAIEDFPLSTGEISRNYPWEVKYRIGQEDLKSWLEAADYINESTAEVVNIQHEFGIYGGRDGEHIVPFLKRISIPKVVTLHTVLSKSDDHYSELLRKIAEHSDALVVMVEAAATRLIDIHKVDPNKIAVIPHGVPDVPFGGTAHTKKRLGYSGRKIISSFGLINRGKRLETLIDAMPKIITKVPEALLLIIGETHPVVKRHEGEVYRQSLEELVTKNGVGDHVKFVNAYLPLAGIIEHLRASDVFVTPYDNMDQISSGTLAYALATGVACVSTPYVYAKEALGQGRGVIVKNNKPAVLAENLTKLLTDDKQRLEYAQKAYGYGRQMIWHRVALKYLNVFRLVAKNGHTPTTDIA